MGSEGEVEAENNVQHLPPTEVLDVPFPQTSRRLNASPLPRVDKAKGSRDNVSRTRTPLKLDTQSSLTSSMQSASSIQTPPPTSSSTSRRRAQEMQDSKALRTPEKRSPTKATHNDPFSALTETSPQPFGNINFSPDVLSFANTGPATAPVHTESRLLWETNQDSNAMNIDFSGGDPFASAFAGAEGSGLESFIVTPKQSAVRREIGHSFTHDDSMIGLSSQTQSQQATFLSGIGLSGSPGRSFNDAVDPSLLFSSPSGPSNEPRLATDVNPPIDDFLQPYAHQIHEALRERDDGSRRPAKRRKKPKTDSPAVKLALQTLKDETVSSTDSRRSSSSRSLLDEDSNRAAFPPVLPHQARPRAKVSPTLHHSRRASKSSSGPQRRTSVRLTIGPDGRAQTKTEYVSDQRNASTRSSQSGESSEESSEDEPRLPTASFNQSFGMSKLGLSQPKMARFSIDPKSHSQKSSYASTTGPGRRSSTQATTQRLKRSSPTKSTSVSDNKRKLPFDQISSSATISDMGSRSRGSDSGTETMIDSGDDRGDAQHELKKILRSRSKRQSQTIPGGLQFGAEIPPYSGVQSAYAGYENTSPTTITDPDIATPSTILSQQSQVEGFTRCVCHGHGADGEAMILWYGPFVSVVTIA